MAVEERNFRNQYYDKMGFRCVEEKKSLESMLASDKIDVKKMTTFCLNFSLPIVTRPLVWKVLLTVLPPHTINHQFVYNCRCQQFDQLIACLRLLDLADQDDGIVGLDTHKSFSGEEETVNDDDGGAENRSCDGSDNVQQIVSSLKSEKEPSPTVCSEANVPENGTTSQVLTNAAVVEKHVSEQVQADVGARDRSNDINEKSESKITHNLFFGTLGTMTMPRLR